MMWPLGKLSKASPTPEEENTQFWRMVTVRPTLAYASGIASPIATRRRGSHEVTIIQITADNGFVMAIAAKCLYTREATIAKNMAPRTQP
jgi:hypothetical protein